MPRSLVILSNQPDSAAGRPPIADRSELLDRLAAMNIAPQSPDDLDALHGPGVRLEFTPGEDPVSQVLLEIVDDDIAWAVIERLRRAIPVRIVDPISGRELGGSA
jgi:hypothetical protein